MYDENNNKDKETKEHDKTKKIIIEKSNQALKSTCVYNSNKYEFSSKIGSKLSFKNNYIPNNFHGIQLINNLI